MIKYVNTGVVFQEVPDEVTLSINISNCPCHCIGCHSEYLWEDTGTPLNPLSLTNMLQDYADDITCVCFMGGDSEPDAVNKLAAFLRKNYPQLKVGWYSGHTEIADTIDLKNFDYIKVGPYVESKGGLKSPDTNQRMYKVNNDKLVDITSKYWKKY